MQHRHLGQQQGEKEWEVVFQGLDFGYRSSLTLPFFMIQSRIHDALGMIVFDSQASPELLSPEIYEEFVLPVTQKFVQWAAGQGVRELA
jgi:hypothetical protein